MDSLHISAGDRITPRKADARVELQSGKQLLARSEWGISRDDDIETALHLRNDILPPEIRAGVFRPENKIEERDGIITPKRRIGAPKAVKQKILADAGNHVRFDNPTESNLAPFCRSMKRAQLPCRDSVTSKCRI
jgi:hypothetical protein